VVNLDRVVAWVCVSPASHQPTIPIAEVRKGGNTERRKHGKASGSIPRFRPSALPRSKAWLSARRPGRPASAAGRRGPCWWPSCRSPWPRWGCRRRQASILNRRRRAEATSSKVRAWCLQVGLSQFEIRAQTFRPSDQRNRSLTL